ncbi:MAG: hypothetical protein ABWX96_13640 [Propionibacteriaceae bacterium]
MSEDYRYLLIEAPPEEIDALRLLLREKLGFVVSELDPTMMVHPLGLGSALAWDQGEMTFSLRGAAPQSSVPPSSEPPP